MCRWLAYIGTPILLEEVLYKPRHSLIAQSLHARLGAAATNGDGGGVGWYGEKEAPGLYRSIVPAWSDSNLRELAAHVRAGVFFAHVRASTASAVQQTNCHPFRHGRWLWMHNGSIANFHDLKRDLMLAVDPALFADIAGTTDSEVLFFLALTFGLDHHPLAAVERAVGFVEETGRAHGVNQAVRMTVAASNGERIWAFRYSRDGRPATLFHAENVETLRHQHPDNPVLHGLSDDTRLVVSEPFGGMAGAWVEAPAASCAVVGLGEDHILPFAPRSV